MKARREQFHHACLSVSVSVNEPRALCTEARLLKEITALLLHTIKTVFLYELVNAYFLTVRGAFYSENMYLLV